MINLKWVERNGYNGYTYDLWSNQDHIVATISYGTRTSDQQECWRCNYDIGKGGSFWIDGSLEKPEIIQLHVMKTLIKHIQELKEFYRNMGLESERVFFDLKNSI